MSADKHADACRMTRRGSLVELGGLLGTALAAGGWRTGTSESAPEQVQRGIGPAGVASGLITCVLTPELTEGPFYIPNEKVRRNITEGRPGVPLTLRLAIVNASTCKPIKGAAVDVWHCDAGGAYSGVQTAAGATFMRGIQKADAKGLAEFRTIYPGWYIGRAVHIHVKVHLGGTVVHTGQLFFPDALTDRVYRKAPYNTRPARSTRNGNDSIFVNGGRRSILALRASGGGYVGAVTMGVHRS